MLSGRQPPVGESCNCASQRCNTRKREVSNQNHAERTQTHGEGNDEQNQTNNWHPAIVWPRAEVEIETKTGHGEAAKEQAKEEKRSPVDFPDDLGCNDCDDKHDQPNTETSKLGTYGISSSMEDGDGKREDNIYTT